MKHIFYLMLFIMLPVSLCADKNLDMMKWKQEQFESDADLTRTFSGFAEINWQQVGAGISIRHLLFIRKFNFPQDYKNYKERVTLEYVNSHGDHINKTYREYESYLAGYIVNLDVGLYPFAGAGMTQKTTRYQIKEGANPVYKDGIYTIKGTSSSKLTGVIGIIYTIDYDLYLEGCLQFYPLLPFLGIGLQYGEFFKGTSDKD